ncbi:hypothetical protein SAMN02745193_01154 [Erythrobacter sanguineus]|uniref:Uncharacterized protein n=1 Tax=Erythrobacter sanguineus TaxID=198312 RepID=A0A1M7S7N3_9SPHN|nr:hypothetical protein SAMN02745193_01154 [Erythrobacter sanguineus]
MFNYDKPVCVKQWQLFAMLAMTGFAIGTIAAKLANALGV